jgi:hypothetical protein
MNPSIPASDIVSVTPSVLSAGGTALDINGLCLTLNTQAPIGTVAPFASQAAVASYFGASSEEARLAGIYFNGFDNSNAKPANMLFAQYPAAAVAAYLRGGPITLAQINALPTTDTLTIVSDGVAETSSAIDLHLSASPSAAATAITAAFSAPSFAVTYDSVSGAFVVKTTATGASATMDFAKSVTATATGSTTTGTTLTIGTATGTFKVGDVVTGTDSTNTIPAGTTIQKYLTGTGGSGSTCQISAAAAPGDLTSSTVTGTGYTGTLAAGLKLGSAQGAVLSQGAAAAVPATFMAALIVLAQNWATFFTVFDPDGGSGNTVKMAFADWTATTKDRYAYLCWDNDASPTTTVPATGSLGYLLAQESASGTCLIYSTLASADLAAFAAGTAASVDYTETEGCITFDFRSQSGVAAQVTSQTIASNLRANGYNFYGAWATANQGFIFFNPGSVSGQYDWLDAYINQIWLNNALQLALMELLVNLKSLPYGAVGTTLIKAACADPINQAVNFGMFQSGVLLSAAQIAEVNAAAGVAIDSALSSQGWYLQVKPAIASVRAARQSPPITLWYVYRESVQTINLASIEVQ